MKSLANTLIWVSKTNAHEARYRIDINNAKQRVKCVYEPLLHVLAPQNLPLMCPPYASLVFSSQNAIAWWCEYVLPAQNQNIGDYFLRPVYAVGAQTMAALRARGFENILTANDNVQSLAKLIVKNHNNTAPLYYVRGEQVSSDLLTLLPKNFFVVSAVVYRSQFARLPLQITENLHADCQFYVLLYSRLAALAWEKLWPEILAFNVRGSLNCTSIAMSAQINTALQNLPHEKWVASAPHHEAMCALIPNL